MTIASVHPVFPDTQVIVTFSGPITWNGVDLPANFQVLTQVGNMDGCIGVLSVGANWIELEFNDGVDVGAPWQVIGPLDGITPAVQWPQSGTVE